MSVLYDYFRAADHSVVEKLMAATDGGPVVRHGHEPVVDAVEGKHIDPPVVLGWLVALAVDAPWRPNLVDDAFVWPAGGDGDPTYEGPWVVVLDDRTRDTLAAIADDRLPDLAARWSRIEELSHYRDMGPDTMLPALVGLVGLARRARSAQDHLYCWICL